MKKDIKKLEKQLVRLTIKLIKAKTRNEITRLDRKINSVRDTVNFLIERQLKMNYEITLKGYTKT